jgi:hypothetical protein
LLSDNCCNPQEDFRLEMKLGSSESTSNLIFIIMWLDFQRIFNLSLKLNERERVFYLLQKRLKAIVGHSQHGPGERQLVMWAAAYI